jgi:hypothetical protein
MMASILLSSSQHEIYRHEVRRHMQTTKTSSRRDKKPMDAIAMLKADHQNVDALFKRFENARTESSKRTLVGEICQELKVHTHLEEEIFYPAVREAIGEPLLMDEAEVEHMSAKDLIAQLEEGDLGDKLYEAKVMVLGEYIRHHVKEEHKEIFPKTKKSGIDLKELGARMQERKDALMKDME